VEKIEEECYHHPVEKIEEECYHHPVEEVVALAPIYN
jgi:hypothetical protein